MYKQSKTKLHGYTRNEDITSYPHTDLSPPSPPLPFPCHSTPLLATEAHHGVHSFHFTLANELLPLYHYAYPQPPPAVHASHRRLSNANKVLMSYLDLSCQHVFASTSSTQTRHTRFTPFLWRFLICLCAYLISSRISLSFV